MVTAKADEMLLDALERTDNTHRRIVVVDDASHVIGLITPTDLARTVRVARLQDSLKV